MGKAGLAGQAVYRAEVEPQPGLVLREDPASRSVWWAVRYVLRVRTNVVIIVASTLGYFFFAGLSSFAVIFVTGHYRLSKPTATALTAVIGAGALAGVLVGGRIADRQLSRGHIRARVMVPAACLLALAPVLAPAIATRSIAVALPLFILGAFLLGAPNPPLDAARLDIIHPRLWGRAEGVRTFLRSLGEAAAPLLFGYVSQYVFGGPGSATGGGRVQPGNVSGLEYTFLVFLIPLLAGATRPVAGIRPLKRGRDWAGNAVSRRFGLYMGGPLQRSFGNPLKPGDPTAGGMRNTCNVCPARLSCGFGRRDFFPAWCPGPAPWAGTLRSAVAGGRARPLPWGG
ncbi:MAG TPA: MFS transporter [Trebonia sp.]